MRLLVTVMLAAACASRTTPDPKDRSPCGLPVAAAPTTAARQVVQRRHSALVRSLAFSPDGRLLASAANDGTAKVWDVRTRALLRTIVVGASETYGDLGVGWDRRGRVIAGTTTALHHVDVETGSEEVVTRGARDDNAVDNWIASPSARWLSIGDGAVFDDRFRRIATLEIRAPISHDHRITPITSDGANLFAFVGGVAIERWPIAPSDDPVPGLAITTAPADTQGFVVLPNDLGIVLRTDRQVSLQRLDGPTIALAWAPRIHDLATSTDGKLFAAATTESIVVWESTDAKKQWSRPVPPRPRNQVFDDGGLGPAGDPGGFVRVVFSPVGHLIAVANRDGAISLFDGDSGRAQGVLGGAMLSPDQLAFVGTGELIVRSSQHVSSWSLTTGRRDRTVEVPDLTSLDVVDGNLRTIRASSPVDELGEGRSSGLDGACGKNTSLYIDRWRASQPPSAFTKTPTCIGAEGLVSDVVGDRILLWGWEEEDAETGYVYTTSTRATLRFTHISPAGVLSHDGSGLLDYDNAGCKQGARRCTNVRLFDAGTGRKELERLVVTGRDAGALPTHSRIPQRIAELSADGTRLAMIDDKRLIVVARATGRDLQAVTLPTPGGVIATGAAHDFVVGANDGTLMLVRDAKVAWTSASSGGAIRSALVSPATRRIATISQDSAVRVWDLASGQQLATLIEFDDDEWIAATPNGSYVGTDEVAERVGWVFDAPAEYFRFEQFAAFRDPDAVAVRLAGGADRGRVIHRPPRIALAGIAQQTAGNSVRLSVHAESATRVDLLRVYAEGRPVAEAKVCAATGDRTIDVPLLAGHNRLSVVAVDDRGYTSNVAAADVTTTNATARRPDIWVIAIGVDKYPHLDARWQLGAAVADARAVADAFAKQASFAKAHVRTLLDDQVTAASVGRALDELAGMQPDDVAIVFLAGHGMKTRDDAPMVFVTGAVTEKTIEAGGIAWTQISDRLARARGRVVVLLDACHAGHVSQDLVVPNGALASSLQKHGRSGVLVFAAAKGRQLSYETRGPRALARVAIERKPVIARQGDHGVFTAAMLGALADPLTDRDRDGTIQLGELVESVIETVGTLPNGEQTPWVARRELFGDFGIAVAPR